MELNDLKQSWNETNKDSKPLHTNIMELLKNKSYSPLATLYRKYQKAAIMIPLMIAFFIIDLRSVSFNSKEKIVLYIFVMLMILIISIVAFTNFYITRRLMNNNQLPLGSIKKQILLIEKSLRLQSYIIVTIGIMVMIIFEIMLQRHEIKGEAIQFISSIPVWTRILLYAVYFGATIYVTKNQRKYATGIYAHLEHLKDILKQAE